MGRPRREDLERLSELREELDSLRLSALSRPAAWVDRLHEIFGAPAAAYSVRGSADFHRVGFVSAAGVPKGNARFARAFGALVERPARWSVYDPDRPQPAQRNRTVVLEPLALLQERLGQRIGRYGLRSESLSAVRAGLGLLEEVFVSGGLGRAWQLRTLVCDRSGLLAWVGLFGREPPTASERWLLQAITPALQRRLLLERQLTVGVGPTAEVLMEQLSGPGWVVDGAGIALHANTLGRAQLDQAPSATRRRLGEAVRARAQGVLLEQSVTPLRTQGGPPTFLVIGSPTSPVEGQLHRAARRWGLTPRQSQVLSEVVAGEPTKLISDHLRCAERTVEAHLTAILHKAEVQSRAALVARFWVS